MEENTLKEKIDKIIRDMPWVTAREQRERIAEEICNLIQLVQVVEDKPVWEIVEYKMKDSEQVYTKDGENWYSNIHIQGMRPMTQGEIECLYENGVTTIHAIRALDSIYRINDRIVWNWEDKNLKYLTIDKIYPSEVRSDNLWISYKEPADKNLISDLVKPIWGLRHYQEIPIEKVEPRTTYEIALTREEEQLMTKYLDELRKAKEDTKESVEKPILITEDNKVITDPEVWVYRISGDWGISQKLAKNAATMTSYRWWSTIESANRYILYNKPLWSLQEIIKKTEKGTGLREIIKDTEEKLKNK